MMLYDFSRLVDKYSVPIEVITYGERKADDNGKIVLEGETTEQWRGAVVPIKEWKKYGPGGGYSENDCQLITKKRLPEPLKNTQVKYKDHTYSVQEETNYSDYANVAVYVLKWGGKGD